MDGSAWIPDIMIANEQENVTTYEIGSASGKVLGSGLSNSSGGASTEVVARGQASHFRFGQSLRISMGRGK